MMPNFPIAIIIPKLNTSSSTLKKPQGKTSWQILHLGNFNPYTSCNLYIYIYIYIYIYNTNTYNTYKLYKIHICIYKYTYITYIHTRTYIYINDRK